MWPTAVEFERLFYEIIQNMINSVFDLHFDLFHETYCTSGNSSKRIISSVRPRISEVRRKYVSRFSDVVRQIRFFYFFHIYGIYCYFVDFGFIVLFSGMFSQNLGNNHVLLMITILFVILFKIVLLLEINRPGSNYIYFYVSIDNSL